VVDLIAINGPEFYSDTMNSIMDSCAYFFTVPSQPSRAWVIQARPLQMAGASYLPTYFGDVLFYSEATIFTTPTQLQFNPPINLIPNMYDSLPWDSITPPQGVITGLISGNGMVVNSVIAGYNVTATFNPSMARVIVMNANGQPVAYAMVNADGSYSINGLPPGQYTVRIDHVKVPSQAVPVEILSTSLNRTVNFSVDVSGINAITSTAKNLKKQNISLAPNPAEDQIVISGASGEYEIVDPIGRVVLKGEEAKISVKSLPAGIYTVIFKDNTYNAQAIRFIKK
jgi:hypothetical protein